MNCITPETHKGWTTNRHEATGVASMCRITAGCLLAGTIAVVGTGGTLYPEQVQARSQRLNMIVLPEIKPTPKQNLERIREVFSPAISDLAASFGVSRQSIYNWLNGEAVAQENEAKLHDLALAANRLVEAGCSADASLLRRKFSANRTLLQLVKDGESADEAITLLIPVLQREAQQRSEMAALFSRRSGSAPTADMDFAAANDVI